MVRELCRVGGAIVLAALATGCAKKEDSNDERQLIRFLPISGPLAQQASQLEPGQNLALQEINRAGGILGAKTSYTTVDTQADPQRASDALDDLLRGGLQVLQGPISSTVAGRLLEQTVPAEVLTISSLASATFLSEGGNNGLFYRTAPTVAPVARALAERLIADGHVNIGIFESGNFYTRSISQEVQAIMTEQGCGGQACSFTVVSYDENEEFSSEKAAEPLVEDIGISTQDAIVFCSYPEDGLQLLRAAIEAGYSETPYVTTSMINGNVALFVNDSLMSSLRWPAPLAEESPGKARFRSIYQDAFGTTDDDRITWQAYDATLLLGLAAEAAGVWEGRAIADVMTQVANAPGELVYPGEYAKAIELLQRGEDIDYEGASGAIEFDELGDVTKGAALFKFGENGEPVVAED